MQLKLSELRFSSPLRQVPSGSLTPTVSGVQASVQPNNPKFEGCGVTKVRRFHQAATVSHDSHSGMNVGDRGFHQTHGAPGKPCSADVGLNVHAPQTRASSSIKHTR